MSAETATQPDAGTASRDTTVARVREDIPPLQAGDRLTRAEFRRRYENMPGTDHAELVEGVVYMPSPVSAERHGEPHASITGWLTVYSAPTPGVRAGDNSTLWLDPDNAPQPDAYLRLEESRGGNSKLVDGYIEEAPELIVEVAASTASHDLHDKLNAYRRNQVQEYIVWRVLDEEIDWFRLREGRFKKLSPDAEGVAEGVIRSEVFPGLWLNVPAMVSRDLRSVLATLQQGLDSDAHQQFVS